VDVLGDASNNLEVHILLSGDDYLTTRTLDTLCVLPLLMSLPDRSGAFVKRSVLLL
jgi:hypothetical protein